jgi:hypothetical protein
MVQRRWRFHTRSMVGVGVFMVGLISATVVGVAPAAAQQATPSVMRGSQVFNDNCQICHGVYAQGRMGPPLLPLPPFITSLPRDAIVADLSGLVRGGIPGRMPGFVPGQVSDSDVGALVDWFLFINSLPRSGGRSFYEALAPATSTESNANRTYVAATRHSISFAFKRFYEQNGGAAAFGNPLTEEYSGFSEVNGEPRVMQLFERARFEFHPGQTEDVRYSVVGSAELNLRMHFLGEGPGGPPAP